MSNINDLYKEAGIKPGNQTPLDNIPGNLTPSKTPAPKSRRRKIISIGAIIFFIGLLANIFNNRGFTNFSNTLIFKIVLVAAIVFGASIIKFIVKMYKKNKNVEIYKEQT